MLPITILLTEQYSDWEIASLAGLGRAFYGADIDYATPLGGQVTSVAGLTIANTKRFEAPTRGVVVVCGSPGFENNPAPEIEARLQQASGSGCVVAGICGGTAVLARAGLLDHVRHTSNAPGYLEKHAPAYAGGAHYVDQPSALRDENIITAPAPAPASFAVAVLTAAGVDEQAAAQIRFLLGKEHTKENWV
ncbi:DJ-1/PfpI family protein [Roseibium sp. SCP14]|uniref:DJ-1/PfpI family protein n=1 Tax=Roseibium sp. SCP14 TaxID=3141375 RepID=UPI00333823D0